MYNIYSCVEISKMLNINLNKIYSLRQKLGLTQKQNPQFVLNDLQKQILFSGRLGDGNFKKNGETGCYYRESHAENELEYLKWKAEQLGSDIISQKGVHPIKKRENPHISKDKIILELQQPYIFSTKTSSVFNYYKDISLSEVIVNLDYRGIILYLLDDGWFNGGGVQNRYGKGHFCISRGVLTNEEANLFCEQCIKYDLTSIHIVSRGDFAFSQSDNELLFSYVKSFLPLTLDIIQKKFRTMLL